MYDYKQQEADIGICGNCVEDQYFAAQISSEGEEGFCENCQHYTIVMTLSDIAAYISEIQKCCDDQVKPQMSLSHSGRVSQNGNYKVRVFMINKCKS